VEVRTVHAPTPSRRREARLGALDVLRFVAAAAVVAFHFAARHSPAWDGPVPQELSGLGQFAAYGRLGVPLFFVISGFVILMTAWGRDVPRFVASRVGRLYPAYWASVVIAVGVIVLWPAHGAFFQRDWTKADVLLNLTMVQTAFGVPNVDGVYWTLWYEARFYLLVALLMLVGITRARVLAFATLWPILGALTATSDNPLLATFLMPDYSAFFAGGMLLYLLYREGHDWGTWLLLGLQGVIALRVALHTEGAALANYTQFTANATVLAVLTFLCFGLVALTTLTPVARLDARWMTFVGALTYPIYLIHENFGWFVIAKARPYVGAWGALLVAVVVALLTAVLLHRLVEKPFGPRLRRMTLTMLTRGSDTATPPRETPTPVGLDDHTVRTRLLASQAPTHTSAASTIPPVRRPEVGPGATGPLLPEPIRG
jgi:peptidoglycan/LPS O-acetylase OafA/YrhL